MTKKLRPTIFLDIDGVLNTPHTLGFQTPQGKIEPELVNNLNMIAGAFQDGINIVISSHWRVWHSLDSITDMLHHAGLRHNAYVVDTTPNLGKQRGIEIRHWLLDHPNTNAYHWCIIDDNPWMLPAQLDRFVMTDSMDGLTISKAKEVIRILSN